MSDRLVVGTRKGLFGVQRDGARGWRLASADFLGDPVSMVMAPDRRSPWFAALDLGHFGVKLHRSEDAGASWHECPAPAYPPKPEEEPEDLDPMRGEPIPWSLKLIWALAGSGEDGGLWCGTMPGGLFRSADGGQSWELIRPLWEHPLRKQWMGGGADWPGIHSILVDPRDHRHVSVAVSCGGVWTSHDGGESWVTRTEGMFAEYMPPELQLDPSIQDPHLVVQCAAAPDRWWAQHHNGIFRSTDAGGHWQQVESARPSAFGFAVAVHPQDPDTAWFVPAVKDEKRYPVDGQLVVSRTRDGGRSFEVLRGGLPQEHAYDLTFRHALDVDGSGERLAFGSTTGSLWVSEDQGERWSLVSANLPPVYCVRFVGG